VIKGKTRHINLVERKNKHTGENFREETATKVGQKYWINFCKGHAREIESKKPCSTIKIEMTDAHLKTLNGCMPMFMIRWSRSVWRRSWMGGCTNTVNNAISC
jgi:hypothetical protein